MRVPVEPARGAVRALAAARVPAAPLRARLEALAEARPQAVVGEALQAAFFDVSRPAAQPSAVDAPAAAGAAPLARPVAGPKAANAVSRLLDRLPAQDSQADVRLLLFRYAAGALMGLAAAYLALPEPVMAAAPGLGEGLLRIGSTVAGFVAGTLFGGLHVHEWGHATGGRLAGARVHWADGGAKFWEGFASTRLQRAALLAGGPLANLAFGSGLAALTWTGFAYGAPPALNAFLYPAAAMNIGMGVGALLPLHPRAGGGLILLSLAEEYLERGALRRGRALPRAS